MFGRNALICMEIKANIQYLNLLSFYFHKQKFLARNEDNEDKYNLIIKVLNIYLKMQQNFIYHL